MGVLVPTQSRFRVEIVWRYVEGHRSLAIHSKVVRAFTLESAEQWAASGLVKKFHPHAIEIVSVKGQSVD